MLHAKLLKFFFKSFIVGAGLGYSCSYLIRCWTQEQLAEAVGIEPISSRLETGHRGLSLSTRGRISEAIQVNLGDLLNPNREVPEAPHTPQEAELVRVFGTISRSRRNLVLRLVRELAP